jgi:hypothetical protein
VWICLRKYVTIWDKRIQMKVEILKLLNSMNLETLVFFSGKKERKKAKPPLFRMSSDK